MFNLSQNASEIAKGVFYILVGAILGLSALNILSGNIMNYLILSISVYFIVYGFFLSGIYDKLLSLFNSK